MKKIYLLSVLIFSFVAAVNSQSASNNDYKTLSDNINSITPKNTSFMVRGYSHFGLNINDEQTTFAYGQFSPIFLWKQGSRFIFETELEFEFEDNQLNIGLEYANASYIVSKALVFRAGAFLLPFGTFIERYHPAWINRLSSKPLGFGHDGIGPSSDLGVAVRGAFQVGKSKLAYDLYVVNGPQLKTGLVEPEEAGMLDFSFNTSDNNKNKAVGGRLGFFPLSSSALEVGLSGYFAKPGSENSPFEGDSILGSLNYQDVSASMYSIDLSFVKNLGSVGLIDIKGQYNYSNLSDANYYNPEEDNIYTFKNKSSAYYAQISYKPISVNNSIIKNLELVGRYSAYNTPEDALWHSKLRQYSIGLNYWLTWRSVIKLSFDNLKNNVSEASGERNEEGEHGPILGNAFYIHWAIGF